MIYAKQEVLTTIQKINLTTIQKINLTTIQKINLTTIQKIPTIKQWSNKKKTMKKKIDQKFVKSEITMNHQFKIKTSQEQYYI